MRNSLRLALGGAVLLSLALSGVANAATLSYSTFGETEHVGPNTEKLISDTAPGYGGLSFNLPAAIDFSDINVLRTTAVPDAGDTCAAGSPRFQLWTDTDGDGDGDGNVFVYVELASVCPADTGDLAQTGGPGDVPGRYDTSQLVLGTQVSTYTATAALFAANPTWQILDISLVVDSGWNAVASGGDGRQAVTVSPTVDVNLPAPSSKDDCKQGGWMSLFRADGSAFKNQGDCIQYANTGK